MPLKFLLGEWFPSAILAANVFIPGVLEISLTCCDQVIIILVVVIIVSRIISIIVVLIVSADEIPHYINSSIFTEKL